MIAMDLATITTTATATSDKLDSFARRVAATTNGECSDVLGAFLQPLQNAEEQRAEAERRERHYSLWINLLSNDLGEQRVLTGWWCFPRACAGLDKWPNLPR
jgi:hypothetical protein